jgi:hypothetical protein
MRMFPFLSSFVQTAGFVSGVVLDDRPRLLEILPLNDHTNSRACGKDIRRDHSKHFILKPALDALTIQQAPEEIGFNDGSRIHDDPLVSIHHSRSLDHQFKMVPPGRYNLRFWPKPNGQREEDGGFYYPGTKLESAAAEIAIEDGTHVDGLQFTIP